MTPHDAFTALLVGGIGLFFACAQTVFVWVITSKLNSLHAIGTSIEKKVDGAASALADTNAHLQDGLLGKIPDGGGA